VRKLVLADRHEVAMAEEDVGGLVDRIGEEQAAQAAAVAGRRLGLDGGVALQLGDADQAQERQQELVERRNRAMGEDRRRGGVDSRGKVIQHQPSNRLGQLAHAVAVRDDLVVGDHEKHLDARSLQANAVDERAEVMAQVQRAGGPVAGQDPEALRVPADLVFKRRLTGSGDVGQGFDRAHGSPLE
jgi:hypothetical protein